MRQGLLVGHLFAKLRCDRLELLQTPKNSPVVSKNRSVQKGAV